MSFSGADGQLQILNQAQIFTLETMFHRQTNSILQINAIGFGGGKVYIEYREVSNEKNGHTEGRLKVIKV